MSFCSCGVAKEKALREAASAASKRQEQRLQEMMAGFREELGKQRTSGRGSEAETPGRAEGNRTENT